jgi:NAD(P)-dependent dehydrogenase (short-subunit alcohol dehydrogenase family)
MIDMHTQQAIDWRTARLPGLDGGGGFVVLGAAGAIGASIVDALTAMRLPVMATARSKDALARISAQVRGTARERFRTRTVDVVDQASAEDAFAEAAAELGGIRGVVNAAAVGDDGMTAINPDAERIRRVLDVNVLGTILPAAAAYPHLCRTGPGASLVNMGSIAAYRAMARGVAYTASKMAVLRVTAQLAVEWGPTGVRVNSISPAQTPTAIRGLDDPIGRAPVAQPGNPSRADDVPLRRMGVLDDYVGPTLFLLSDLAAYVTGQDVLVDGGIAWRRFTAAPTTAAPTGPWTNGRPTT